MESMIYHLHYGNFYKLISLHFIIANRRKIDCNSLNKDYLRTKTPSKTTPKLECNSVYILSSDFITRDKYETAVIRQIELSNILLSRNEKVTSHVRYTDAVDK